MSSAAAGSRRRGIGSADPALYEPLRHRKTTDTIVEQLEGLRQLLDALAAQGLVEAPQPAREAIVKGFMVGRTIWGDASRAWLAGAIDDAALIEQVAARFGRLAQAWRARHER